MIRNSSRYCMYEPHFIRTIEIEGVGWIIEEVGWLIKYESPKNHVRSSKRWSDDGKNKICNEL